jgi:hypothetical protein
MRRRLIHPASLIGLVLLALAVGMLVQRAWPKTANAPMRQTLDRLRGSSVPVFVIIPQQPRDLTSSLEPDGYTYTIVRGDPLIVQGRRTGQPDAPPARSGPGQLRWTQAGTTYTITAESDLREGTPAGVMERVIPLELALRQNWGFTGDSPLLYLVYLPLLAGFGAWACWSLMIRGDWRTRSGIVDGEASAARG